MPSFVVVPHPLFSPTRCVTCGSNRDPEGFVDLLVDDAALGFDQNADPIHDPHGVVPTIGHLYMCVTCLFQAANAAGCLLPAAKAEAEQNVRDAETRIAELTDALEEERRNKTVDLDELRKIVAERSKPGPKTKQAAPAPEAA